VLMQLLKIVSVPDWIGVILSSLAHELRPTIHLQRSDLVSMKAAVPPRCYPSPTTEDRYIPKPCGEPSGARNSAVSRWLTRGRPAKSVCQMPTFRKATAVMDVLHDRLSLSSVNCGGSISCQRIIQKVQRTHEGAQH
jgi:hypothetical protein